MSGLKDLEKELKQLAKNVQDVTSEYDGKSIGLDELLPSSFMETHTHYDNADDWLEAGGFNFESQEEYEELTEANALDHYVSQSTDFNTFQEMLETAAADMISSKIFG
ncbi:MAG: hypothetical protein ACK5MV_00405 [Aminipila sp.]